MTDGLYPGRARGPACSTCRSEPADAARRALAAKGRRAASLHDAGHIPGAALVGPGQRPGRPARVWRPRFPCPRPPTSRLLMRRPGVRDGRPVVVYDDADSTAAARAWWLLRYFGHQPCPGVSTEGSLPGGGGLTGGAATWSLLSAVGRAGWAGAGHRAPAARGSARLGQLALLDPSGAASIARPTGRLDARAGERYRGESGARRPGGKPHSRRGQRPDGREREPGRHLQACMADLAARFAAPRRGRATVLWPPTAGPASPRPTRSSP